MTLPKVTKTNRGFFFAKLDGLTTATYSNPVAALRVLCEMLVDRSTEARRKQRHLSPPSETCDCGGPNAEWVMHPDGDCW